jgi:hypothetical protein
VLLGYLILSAAVFGHDALLHLQSMVLGFGQEAAFYGRDQGAYVWFLGWGEHQLAGLHNPLSASVLFAPFGFNLAWAASIQGPALLMSPITKLAGAVVSYNLLAVAAPAVAAWTAYLLCRYVVRGARAPALAGGLLFGFGTYEAVQMVNHLNLALVALVPVAVLLALLRYDGRIPRWAFVVGLGLIVVAQLWTSTEVLATMCVFATVALALAALLGGRERRGAIGRLALEAFAGLVLGVLLGLPFIYHAYHYENPAEQLSGSWDSADPLNLLVPTQVTWLWELGLHSQVKTHNPHQNLTEQVAYLGLPLLALLIAFGISFRRKLTGRLLMSFIGVTFLLSLGTQLVVNGTETGVWLPWKWLAELPALRIMMPARFFLYIWLAIAVAAACWLARPAGRRWRWSLFALAVICLLPNFTGVPWGTRVDSPPLMNNPKLLARYVPPGATVLALPFGINGDSMSWQQQTHFSFHMAGGYVGLALPSRYLSRLNLIYALGGRRFEGDPTSNLCAFLRLTHTNVILLREGAPGSWGRLLNPLRIPAVRVGGFYVLDPRPAFESGGACRR